VNYNKLITTWLANGRQLPDESESLLCALMFTTEDQRTWRKENQLKFTHCERCASVVHPFLSAAQAAISH